MHEVCAGSGGGMSADDQGLGALFSGVGDGQSRGNGWGWQQCWYAQVRPWLGKTEAASSNIGSGIDTASDLSASPTLQRW